MSIELKIDRLQHQIITTYKERLNLFQSLCESPIEKLFLLNFINHYESEFPELVELTYLYDIPEISPNGEIILTKKTSLASSRSMGFVAPWALKLEKGFKALLTPQFEVLLATSKYRVDFFLLVTRHDGSEMRICIECDGYDFHQKTKEQVNKDNQRDRDLISNGYLVFRYSGSELYAKSDKSFFKELMDQIEKAALHDLLEKERIENDKFLKEYAKNNKLSQDQLLQLRKAFQTIN